MVNKRARLRFVKHELLIQGRRRSGVSRRGTRVKNVGTYLYNNNNVLCCHIINYLPALPYTRPNPIRPPVDILWTRNARSRERFFYIRTRQVQKHFLFFFCKHAVKYY